MKKRKGKNEKIAHYEAKLKAIARLTEEWEALLPPQFTNMLVAILRNK